jgi:large subunit ribosomal protein L2
MSEKKIKPNTPAQRHTILITKPKKDKTLKIKKLIQGFQRANGRNHQGKITVRYKGGGHKRLYRKVEFNRSKLISGSVQKILYDPNRSAHLAYIKNDNQEFLILAPLGIQKHQKIESGKDADIQIGNALPLREIPIGTLIHNISLRTNEKGKLIRSAGTSAQLIQKIKNEYAKIRLTSGQFAFISLNCYATIGKLSNVEHQKRKLGKAGRSRWLNKKPKVRGVAKNPVDHPHGGGEGKTSGGRPSVTPQGRITKGKPTRKKKKKVFLL